MQGLQKHITSNKMEPLENLIVFQLVSQSQVERIKSSSPQQTISYLKMGYCGPVLGEMKSQTYPLQWEGMGTNRQGGLWGWGQGCWYVRGLYYGGLPLPPLRWAQGLEQQHPDYEAVAGPYHSSSPPVSLPPFLPFSHLKGITLYIFLCHLLFITKQYLMGFSVHIKQSLPFNGCLVFHAVQLY